jgi:hypothetical protein
MLAVAVPTIFAVAAFCTTTNTIRRHYDPNNSGTFTFSFDNSPISSLRAFLMMENYEMQWMTT